MSVLSVCSVILGVLPRSFKALSREGSWPNGEKTALMGSRLSCFANLWELGKVLC